MENLIGEAKLRYQKKISVINGLDPFRGCIREPVETVPTVDASDFHCEAVQNPQIAGCLQPVHVWLGQRPTNIGRNREPAETSLKGSERVVYHQQVTNKCFKEFCVHNTTCTALVCLYMYMIFIDNIHCI